MSSWGNLDNVAATGTVTAYVGNTTVTGSGTAFTTEIDARDYITIGGRKFQVDTITSDTVLDLTANGIAAAGVTAYIQQGPKFVANVSSGNLNEPTIQDVVGVDRVEIAVSENQARGVASHTGWVTYKTYTDAYSQTRHKSEVLVAMSKNFSANAAGDLFGTGAGADGDDDTVAADYQVIINTQPASASADTGNAITFFTVAATSPTGQTLTYQWYEDNTTHTYALTDTGVYSDTTTNTLSISDVTGLDTYGYYVIVGGTGGADSVTSDTATLTETTP